MRRRNGKKNRKRISRMAHVYMWVCECVCVCVKWSRYIFGIFCDDQSAHCKRIRMCLQQNRENTHAEWGDSIDKDSNMCKRVPLRCIHIAVRVYRRFYVYVTLAENVFVSHQYKMNSHIIPTHLRVRLLLFLFLRLIFFLFFFRCLHWQHIRM